MSTEPTNADLLAELAPKGALEQTFATEITGAASRLRRCGRVEEYFTTLAVLDSMIDDKTERQQKSVDRARGQSHLILRRSLAELRTLQTERQIRVQLFPDGVPGEPLGVMNFLKAVQTTTGPAAPMKTEDLKAMAKADAEAMLAKESAPGSFCKTAETPATAGTSFCKPAGCSPAVSTKVPRNVPCPCGSGAKYKKCCGGPNPPDLNIAA
jgi:preprotein translocase subunit SecA